MPGSGFGFPNYPQRPSVDPNQVGQLLVERAQEGQPAPGNVHPSALKSQADGQGPAGDPLSTLTGVPPRLLGAYQDSVPSGGSAVLGSAVSAAARDADRRGPKAPTQQQQAPAPFTDEQLLRMGISPAELRLLKISGGVK